MLEKTIEKAFVREVNKKGGLALKLNSAGCKGLPDRMVLLPKGRIGFVELKAPGKKTRAVQEYVCKRLKDLGFNVWVLDSPDIGVIGGVLNAIQAPSVPKNGDR